MLHHSLIHILQTAQSFTNTPPQIPLASYMISIASRDAFGGFTFAAFSAKNIPVVVVVMTVPSLIKSSMFFFPVRTTHLLYRVFSSSYLKHMTSFWWLILFFIDLVFICSLGSVICKKYENPHDKDRKHTNTIDISITGSSGSSAGSAGGSVGSTGSFIACFASILLSFFASFRILYFNLFMQFSLPLRAASTRFGSFLTFCDVLPMVI